jgi:hypothetical protein
MIWVEIILAVIKLLPDIIALLQKIFAKSAGQGLVNRLRTEQKLKTALLNWRAGHEAVAAGHGLLGADAVNDALRAELADLEASL